MSERSVDINCATGKLGILLPGMGAVATTFILGVVAMRRGIGEPVGSLTQLGTIRLGKRTEDRHPFIKDFVSLASLDDLVFGGWDIYDDNCYEAALRANVLDRELIESLRDEIEQIEPWPGVFDRKYVRNLKGGHVKQGNNKMDLAEQLMEDVQSFKHKHQLDRMVAIWCGSTEAYCEPTPVHASLAAFELGLKESDPDIAPSQIYAYALLKSGVPFANGAPNLTVDIPAMEELACQNGVPLAGKDFKTGQTLMKTIIAPGLKSRMLGMKGWFSTNILGNRDGEVLDDPESFRTKEVSKKSVLEHILQPDLYKNLYGDLHHVVRINYYPPHGDNKEGWDNIDIFGWLGYPMQIKINFLCRDSILAAPLVLDLALFLDLAKRTGMSGIQEWLSFYFKSPMCSEELYPEHDLFIQNLKLTNTLRYIRGEEQITHLGVEYYDSMMNLRETEE